MISPTVPMGGLPLLADSGPFDCRTDRRGGHSNPTASVEVRSCTGVRVEPDWPTIHCELKRKHVTLSILWDEYFARDPEGYRYSRFCDAESGEGKLSITMRQTSSYANSTEMALGGFYCE